MKFARLFVYVLLILLLPAGSKAQSWGGILAPARGIDWSKAGIPGGIPSGSWTQCGATIAAYSGTADAINKAISSCGTNEYVLLGPGNFNLSTSIFIQGKNRVALRGSGASKTFLVFGAGANHSCMGGASSCLIGVQASDGSFWDQPANLTNWTAGYTQATNQITLSNTSNIKPNATMIVLDQDDNGYAGYGV